MPKNLFTQDNFASRRTTGNNMYDPESLITGAEVAVGFTYKNSVRNYPDEETYLKIVHGEVPVSDVPTLAPRMFRPEGDTIKNSGKGILREIFQER